MRSRASRWWVAALVLGLGCSGTGSEVASVAVPEGELSGAELRELTEELATVHGVPVEAIPASPTFEGGGTAVMTSCFLAVGVITGAQQTDVDEVLRQLDMVSALAVGHEEADAIQAALAEIGSALEVDDSVAFARGGAQVLDACAQLFAR
jgi:hypothetical protein